MKRSQIALLPLLGALAVAGCEEATGPADQLSARELQLLAPRYDQVGAGILDGVAHSAHFVAGSRSPSGEFTHTRACPAGGSLTVAGAVQRSYDEGTRTLTVQMTATQTPAACAFATRDGTIVTKDGNPNLRMEGTRRLVDGKPSGLQITTHKGSFRWTRGSASGVCDIDLTSTFDPATGTRTVKGTSCGRSIDRSFTRGRG